MDKEVKKKLILNGIKGSLVKSLIVAGIVGVIAYIYSLFAKKYAVQSMAYAFYYAGVFFSILSLPQLWKRNEDPKLKKIRRQNSLFGFGNRASSQLEEYEGNGSNQNIEAPKEPRLEGFWFGIVILVLSLCLFLYGMIMENIYISIWR